MEIIAALKYDLHRISPVNTWRFKTQKLTDQKC